MTTTSNAIPVQPDTLRDFCTDCFVKLGLGAPDAAITADNLVYANLRGVDSHGVIRLKNYAQRFQAGGVHLGARPTIVSETAGTALIDADNGVGQVAGRAGMELAITKAKETGIGFVGVAHSNHFGAAAYYAMAALEQNMIGFASTNAGASMAPTGGREARLGNNPFAVAVPAGKYPPIILDMATGAVAWGKIFLAQQEGQAIPASWALDKNGTPTTDANAAAGGGLIQPIGGYKGYGLSLLIDILTGVLCGSSFSNQVIKLREHLGKPVGCAHNFSALRIDTFMPVTEFHGRVEAAIELMKYCPPAPGAEPILVPGEIEHGIEQERRSRGIPLNPVIRDELTALGQELGVPPPFARE